MCILLFDQRKFSTKEKKKIKKNDVEKNHVFRNLKKKKIKQNENARLKIVVWTNTFYQNKEKLKKNSLKFLSNIRVFHSCLSLAVFKYSCSLEYNKLFYY